jgi:hypothetical protein
MIPPPPTFLLGLLIHLTMAALAYVAAYHLEQLVLHGPPR